METKTNNTAGILIAQTAKMAVLILVICLFNMKFMGGSEFSVVLIWWLTLFALGLLFQPLALMLFRNFHDNGWVFGKALGLAVSGWFIWFLSSLKLMKFTRANCLMSVAITVVLSLVLFYFKNRFSENKIRLKEAYTVDKVCSMINAELIFFVLFTCWCYLKGYKSAAYGTERFMDYGYMTAILKSEYMPPKDTWYAGKSINYYYVGQYMSAYLTRLSGVSVGFGYNLSLMTLASFGFTMPFSIGSNLVRSSMKESIERGKKFIKGSKGTISTIAGVLSGTAVSFAGNMHFPIFKWIWPKVQRIKGDTDIYSYWFPDATRYIGYYPETNDKTIHEFPSYSFVLGDLHAHVINTMFVMTVLAIILAWIIEKKPSLYKVKPEYDEDGNMIMPKISIVREMLSPHVLACSFLVGLFHTTNYWDFPIYTVVCVAAFFFINLVRMRYSIKACLCTLLQTIEMLAIGFLVSLPFTLSFDSISTGIGLCDRHTKFYQLMVLWGLPATLVLSFLVYTLAKVRKREEDEDSNYFTRLFDEVLKGDFFALTIGLSAIGLVILPEIIYVKDIYGEAYQRSNTMFKLTYQAYIMFAIAMSYILVRFICFRLGKMVKIIGICGLILFCSTVGYFFEATNAWFWGGYYTSLDASDFLKSESAEDKAGIDWINENVPDDKVVLEMCGLSYSFFNRISVFTGNETVLGWQTHEWLWRSSGKGAYPAENTERHDDIIDIYTSTDVEHVRELIEKYNIDYIYVGEAEHVDGFSSMDSAGMDSMYYHGSYYKKIVTNDALLKSIGEVHMIAEAGGESFYDTYIVEIDHDKEITDKYILPTGNLKISRPQAIVYEDGAYTKDFLGNVVKTVQYEYDEEGNVSDVKYFDAEDKLLSYSQFMYDIDGRIISGVDFDGAGNRYSFWNYIEYDNYNRCTKAYCFKDDDSYWYTKLSEYDGNGLVSESYSYYDEHAVYVGYDYVDGFKTYETINDDRESDICYIEYINDGEKIVGADMTVGTDMVGKLVFYYPIE